MKEIPVGDYFVLQLFQSTKWEGSVTWCQIIGGDRYCAGFFVIGKEHEESVARQAEREARRQIEKGFE
jgi:hypothetical protein